MNIQSTILWTVIEKILLDGEEWRYGNFKIMLHTVDKDIEITQLLHMDIERDYQSAYADVVYLSFKSTLGVYRDNIYPYKHNLECTIINKDDPSDTHRYKAIFLEENFNMDSSKQSNMSTETLDTGGLITVNLQLMDRVVEPLRIKTTGGVYKGVTNTEILKGLIHREIHKVKITDNITIDGIDIAPSQNTLPVRQTVIPHGTKVVELPKFLQLKGTGIYTGGINIYIQYYNGINRVFIYPTYNYDRYMTEKPRVTFYAVPDNIQKLTEKTWKVIDDNLHVVVSNKREVSDDGETKQMETGVGFKTINAARPMLRIEPSRKMYPPIDDTDVVGSTDINIVANASKLRKDGVVYSPILKPTINPYKYQSVNNYKLGIFVTFNWINSAYDYIYPGMPCSYNYYYNDELMFLTGVVSRIYTMIDRQGKYTSMVTLFLKRPSDMMGL